MENPFHKASRKTYAAKGQPSLVELHPMIEIKARYQDRLAKLRAKIVKQRDQVAEQRRRDLLSEGRLTEVKSSTRAQRRAGERYDRRQQRKGQRHYDRVVEGKARREFTAGNQARALVGEFGPQMQRNVQVIADREEARQRAGA